MRPSRHAWVLPSLSVLAIVMGGCGGDSTSWTPPPAPSFYRVLAAGRDVGPPPIKENLTQAERRIAGTVASGDCDQIKALFVLSVVDDQPDQSCETLRTVEGARLSGAMRYSDQAAVLDYSTAPEASSIVLLRDADGLLRIAFVAPHSRPTTVDTPLGKSADRIADAVVAAIRVNDCAEFVANANSAGGVGALPDRQACLQMATDPIRQAQFDGSATKPVRLGGNGQFAFYALDGNGVHATMVLAKADPGAGIQESPRAAPDQYGYVGSYVTNTQSGAARQ